MSSIQNDTVSHMTKIKSTFSVNFLTKAALVALVLVMYNVRLVGRSVGQSAEYRDSSEALGLGSFLDL